MAVHSGVVSALVSLERTTTMRTAGRWARICFVGAALTFSTGAAFAEDISGIISTTRTIREDSRLVGDVTCTVTGAPCIMFGASHIGLRLNGFSMTGLADPANACNGTLTAGEHGISTNSQADVEVRGPGRVQRFRAVGVIFVGTLLGRVDYVTVTTNCQAGILVNPASSRITVTGNLTVRNGSAQPGFPCGGI
jgi:hypothetical protein